MTDDILSQAVEALQQDSEEYEPFELDAYYITGPDGDTFATIGVNEEHDEAVATFEAWRDEWHDRLYYVGSSPLDDAPEVVVHEYRNPDEEP